MHLLIQEPGKPARQLEASPGLTIGRGPGNACALDDDSASSQHARVVQIDGRLAIEDLGSRNGTRIEGGTSLARGQHFLLSPDLVIHLGQTTVRVLSGDRPEIATVRSVRPAGDADPAATQRRAAPPAENATMRPAPAPIEAATMRHVPAPAPAPNEAVTLRPATPAAAAPRAPAVPPAATPAKPATVVPPASKPASQVSIPIPATVPKESDPRTAEDLGIGGTIRVGPTGMGEAAIRASFAAYAPRIVFVAHKVGRSEALPEPETRVGRRKNEKVHVGLDDEGVSSSHALVAFDGQAFFVEDLDSKNGTWVGDAKLGARPNRLEVRCDQRIRFGTVDALFVRKPATGEDPDPSASYADALAELSHDGTLPADKLREAHARLARREHPGEFLITSNALGVARWCEAIENARLRSKVTATRRTRPGNRTVWMLGVALVLAVATIVLLALR